MGYKIVRLKIDCSKIDKARLFEGKNGARYLDATVFINDEADKFGNHGMITQDVSQDERKAGVKGAILGNVKVMGNGGAANGGGVVVGQAQAPAAVQVDAVNADLPF